MPTPLEKTVAEYFAAIRAMDPDRIVANFAPEGEHHDPVGVPPYIGHEAIHGFFTQIFSGFQTLSLTEDGVFANGNSAAIMWTGNGVAPNGRAVSFNGVDVVDCNEAGKIVLMRAFWDPLPVIAALQG